MAELKNINLLSSCIDKPGIVAAVSKFIMDQNCSIIDAGQHLDLKTKNFYMRYEFSAPNEKNILKKLEDNFVSIKNKFDMQVDFVDADIKKKVVLMASKETHCIEDILYRVKSGDLNCEIVAVISNHEILKDRVNWHKIPFIYSPIDNNKSKHFAEISEKLDNLTPDCIVLAKYMQILPENICEKYKNKLINIHHSFLPAFVGSKPYQQAFDKGVKIIGATSHFVTADLDQGPIIEQDVMRVSHRDNVSDFIRNGRDIERLVLARALAAYLEDRVVISDDGKTIVF
jgi:formyltetrahydrofolate deformylase